MSRPPLAGLRVLTVSQFGAGPFGTQVLAALGADDHDNLWIAANQADEIVVIDLSGRTIAKLGDFNGLDHDGAPLGLLFPASLVFSGPFVYVTNLAIDLRLFGAANATGDSPWTADVTVHTISRIPAFTPPIHGLPTH